MAGGGGYRPIFQPIFLKERLSGSAYWPTDAFDTGRFLTATNILLYWTKRRSLGDGAGAVREVMAQGIMLNVYGVLRFSRVIKGPVTGSGYKRMAKAIILYQWSCLSMSVCLLFYFLFI